VSASWHRLGRRTMRPTRFSIPWFILWFVAFVGTLYLVPPTYLVRVFGAEVRAVWVVCSAFLASLAPVIGVDCSHPLWSACVGSLGVWQPV